MDINPNNNRDTFRGRGARIEFLERQLHFIQNNLKNLLSDIEKSPQIITFEKDTLVRFIKEQIEAQ